MIASSAAGPAILVRTGDRNLYHSGVAKRVLLGMQKLRREMAERVRAVTEDGEHDVFTHYGKPIAVLVPIEWYRDAARAVGDPTDL
jgi:hypothetical protein